MNIQPELPRDLSHYEIYKLKIKNGKNFVNSLKRISYFTAFFFSRPVSKCIINTARFAYFATDKFFVGLHQGYKKDISSGNVNILERAKRVFISSLIRIGIVALSAIAVTGIVLGATQLAMTLFPIGGMAIIGTAGISSIGISALLLGIYRLDPQSLLNILDFSLTVSTYLFIVPSSFGVLISPALSTFFSHLSLYLIDQCEKQEPKSNINDLSDLIGYIISFIKEKCDQESPIDRLSVRISESFL